MKFIAILTIFLAMSSLPLLADEQSPGDQISAAIDSGDINAVKALIEGGLSVNTPLPFDQDEISPLIKSCLDGQYDIGSYLIQAGANVNWANQSGRTALITAVETDQLELTQLLIDHGADVNAKNSAQFTALGIASANGNDEIVTRLVQAGALLQQETSGMTSVMIATMAKKESTISLLINLGAPVDQISSVSGETALFQAIHGGDAQIIQSLIQLGANVNFRTSDGNTPLKAALKDNQTNIVATLEAAGATQ